MSFYKYVSRAFQSLYKTRSPALRERIKQWRKQGVVERIERPTNLPRARSLGYRAKKEFILARVRIAKGKRRRRRPDLGRKPGKNRKTINPGKPLDWLAGQKALSRFPNLRLVNTYYAGEDGQYKFYEVILRNPCQ